MHLITTAETMMRQQSLKKLGLLLATYDYEMRHHVLPANLIRSRHPHTQDDSSCLIQLELILMKWKETANVT